MPIKKIIKQAYALALQHLPDGPAIQLMYARRFKALPNLSAPRTFNEKIAWRKLHQKDPRFPVFADKLRVKDEVARLAGAQYVIETLWSGDRPEDIPFDRLTPPYVIKVSHSSGENIFVHTQADIDRPAIFRSLHKQLAFSHHHRFREWGYKDIPRKILVERMLKTPDGGVPEDYKFFVYGGRTHFIQVDQARFERHARVYYDREWNTLPLTSVYPMGSPGPRPARLDAMLALAEKMGTGFDSVRIDLYDAPEGIKFGEATFYHGAGLEGFSPPEWDRAFGDPWIIKG
jgi:TupA-like ATPgrasp